VTLADRIEAFLTEQGPQPGKTIARAVRKQDAEVVAVLHGDDRFDYTGSTKGRRWFVLPTPAPAIAPEALREAVWRARRRGELTGVEALEILIAPTPRLLKALA
jgi:hypothetical protein